MTTTTERRVRCTWCNELTSRDDADHCSEGWVCESCRDYRDYCQICNSYCECRHVKWVDEVGLCGCGGTHVDDDDHREEFETLLIFLENCVTVQDREPLLPRLRENLAANNLWTTWFGSLLGPSDLAIMYECRPGVAITLADIRAGEMEEWPVDGLQIGMAWLTSLEPDTKDANALTVKWIDEWLSKRGGGSMSDRSPTMAEMEAEYIRETGIQPPRKPKRLFIRKPHEYTKAALRWIEESRLWPLYCTEWWLAKHKGDNVSDRTCKWTYDETHCKWDMASA